MEFCKLVFCYNDDTEFVNETEKLPNTNECHSCSCESIEEFPKSDECRDCTRGSSKRFTESETCICETESEYTRRIDKNTITDKYCVCGNRKIVNILQVDKVTITDETHGIHCFCYSNLQSNNVAVRDSREQCPNQVSNESNTLYLQCAHFLDKPDTSTNRIEPCIGLDESQTPIKECSISNKDKEVCRDFKYTSGFVESSTSCRCLSTTEANNNFPTNNRSAKKVRHVCFCTKSIDSKNCLGRDAGSKTLPKGEEKLGKPIENFSHESQLLKEKTRYVIRQSIGTSTRSIVETANRLAQISKDVFETENFNSETKQEWLPAIKESPVKSLSAQHDQKKAAKSSQTKKTSSKKYLTNSTDDLVKGPSRLVKKINGQSPKKLVESEAKKRSTKMPTTERKLEIPRDQKKITKMICQCCQEIFKSPSAPCVSVSQLAPQKSMKCESTSIQTVEHGQINGTVQKKGKSESPLETNDCELKTVQEEGSIEEEEDKEVNDEEKPEENMDGNKKDKKHDNICDLEEVIARYNGIHTKKKDKPIEKQHICREVSVTKEDIDIIEDYFKDREDVEEETPKSSKKIKNGSSKYHYLMIDTPCATVEIKDSKLLGGKGELKYNFLRLDAEEYRPPPPKRSGTTGMEKSLSSRDSESSLKKVERQRRISYRSQTQLQPSMVEQITQGARKLASNDINQQNIYRPEQDRYDHRSTFYSDFSESISDTMRKNGMKRINEHLGEMARIDIPEDEKEINTTDANWMGPNQGLTANLETYGSLEKMVVDRIIPDDQPHHVTNNKEPVSVFEEILKEEKRKFVRSSMASQRSTQKFRGRGSSKFINFFKGWMTNKTDKKKQGGEKRRKSITIRESDDEIVSPSLSDASLVTEQERQDRQRSSVSSYRTRPYPNLAPRQSEGVYSR